MVIQRRINGGLGGYGESVEKQMGSGYIIKGK